LLRVTADTNILISGLNFRGGKPFQFLELAREGKIDLTVSGAILDEMADVLARKFDFTPEEIADARKRIAGMARTVRPAVQIDVIKEDPPDNRILECAVAAGSEFIVTGDKDLLPPARYDSIADMRAMIGLQPATLRPVSPMSVGRPRRAIEINIARGEDLGELPECFRDTCTISAGKVRVMPFLKL